MCGGLVESDFGLCGPCWRDTAFLGGVVCDSCGVPLTPGGQGDVHLCDGCLNTPRPWIQGRSAILYRDKGRKLVLSLKHGDRQEIARPAALWMANAMRGMLEPDTIVMPVPLHWSRLLKRRYNQSALLAKHVSRLSGHDYCPDALLRYRRTASLDGMSHDERYNTLEKAIRVHPRRAHLVTGRPVLLVDDVLTSGATLSAATQACLDAGSGDVRIVTLARAAKDA